MFLVLAPLTCQLRNGFLRLFMTQRRRKKVQRFSVKCNADGLANFCQATEQINDPAKLHLLIQMIDSENWSRLDVDVKGEAYEGPLNAVAGKVDSGSKHGWVAATQFCKPNLCACRQQYGHNSDRCKCSTEVCTLGAR
jgi:hypothetical protein